MRCDTCKAGRCKKQEGAAPKDCPTKDLELIAQADALLREPENAALFHAAALVESEGYGRWPRVREIYEFCRRMGFTRIGLAFCTGLSEEAETFARMMRDFGLTVVSAVCKMSNRPKEDYGILDSEKVRPGQFEVICNPVMQALYLNREQVDLCVVLGLCVGHDALFNRYAKPPVVTLVVKDRALANNPVGALYCGYAKKLVKGER